MKYAERRKKKIDPLEKKAVKEKFVLREKSNKRTKLSILLIQNRINMKTLYDIMQERSPRTCCTYQYLRNIVYGRSSDFKISVAVMISDILEVPIDSIIDKKQIKTD